MSKSTNERRYPPNVANATLKNIRISPQKLNLVAGLIRGKRVESALRDLSISRKRIAKEVYKVLLSAISNAETNHGLDIDDLVVREAFVGKGLVMKRFMARARGRGSRIIKTFSQIDIVVGADKELL